MPYPEAHAAVAELAYALDLGSSVRKDVEVRLLSAAFGKVECRIANIELGTRGPHSIFAVLHSTYPGHGCRDRLGTRGKHLLFDDWNV